jgi:prophage antirepressor-like protein
MSAIQIHSFRGHNVRIAVANPEAPEWVAKDVCDALELTNSRKKLAELDADEKGVTICDTPGGAQEMATVTEPGLYSLIMSSRKDSAVEFKRWVTHEVLPSIRRTGSYGAPALDLAAVAGAVAAILLPQVKALLGSPVEARTAITKGQADGIRSDLRWLAVQLHRGAPTTSRAGWRSKRDLRLRNRVDYPRGPGNGWDNLPASKLDQARKALDEMRADVADLVNPARQLVLTKAS